MMEIRNVDLIKVAQQHLAFLEDIEAISDGLHRPHVIRNAIRRYETIWLPLVAENQTMNLEAPLDVHWVWHVHMLCPGKYASDCQAIVGMVPDHEFFLTKTAKKAARALAEQNWCKLTTEPFDVDFNSIKEDLGDSRMSKITYDITQAADRQKEFFYNVSLLHFSYTTFLEAALERYLKFVALKRKHRKAFLVPMYDIDLMWHSHQLCPVAYRADMQTYLGYVMDHDDSTTDRSPDSQLSIATTDTKALWEAEYPESPYFIPGVMYRGKNPRGELEFLTQEETYGIYRPGFKVSIMKVELTGAENILKKKYIIRGHLNSFRSDKRTPDFDVSHDLKEQKGDFSWKSEYNGFASFIFNDFTYDRYEEYTEFVLNMERRDGIISFIGKRKPLFAMKYKVTYDRLFKSYLADPTAKAYYFAVEGTSKTNLTSTLYFRAEKLGGPSKSLKVQLGSFESSNQPVPKGVRLGPVPLASVMEGQTSIAAFSVAEHIIKDTCNAIFTARVIHSIRLRTSLLQIFKDDRLLVVSHLIGSEQLPRKTQIGCLANKCIALDRGERAMLIKNGSGDWAVVRGRWEGFQKAEPPKKKGKPGYLLVTIQREQKISSARFGVQEFFSFEDLHYSDTSHTFQLSCFSKDIAEYLALGLSVCTLYVLCEPRVCPPGIPDLKKPRIRETGSSHTYIMAMGYQVPTPSNSWLYYHHTMAHRWRDEWYDDWWVGEKGEEKEVTQEETGDNNENCPIVPGSSNEECQDGMLQVAAEEFDGDAGEALFCPWEGIDKPLDVNDTGISDVNNSSSMADTAACGGCTALSSPSSGDTCLSSGHDFSGGGGFSVGNDSSVGWQTDNSHFESSGGGGGGGGGGSSHDYDSGVSSGGGGGGCGSSCASSSGGGGGGGCGSSCGSSCGGD